MNDRFKFRAYAWDTRYPEYERKDYVMSVDCIDFSLDLCMLPYKGGDKLREESIRNIILMQCTGLKDENGVLIYEGDIVIFCNEDYAEVIGKCEYVGASFCLKHNDMEYCLECDIVAENSEVIGNIHENGDLLT